MATDNWKDTLYIWDGIVTVGIPQGGGGDESQDSPVPLQWDGSWVPVTGVPDAANAEAPKRHASKRDLDAECKFFVKGTATRLKPTENSKDDASSTNNDDRFFVAKLTKGDGWEMQDGTKKSRYHDVTHDVWIKSLKWSGNQKDQRESLVVAKGKNDFGPFVSVGWIRPGCRWTVARRYLSETDPRAGWSQLKFYQAVVGDVITTVSGAKTLRVPPWQTHVMHVDYQNEPAAEPDTEASGGGKRQKTGNE